MPLKVRGQPRDGLHRLVTRVAGVALLVTVFFSLVVGDAAPIGSTTSLSGLAASAAPAVSTIGALSIDTGQMDHLGETRQYRYVILQEYMHAHIDRIKRANPNTKVLAYFDAAATKSGSCADASKNAYAPHDSFGVNFCYAETQHPQWFLHDSSGQRLSYADYPRYMAMDIGNRAYQHTWAANAISAARSDGFDGIYIDDVNTYPGHGINGRLKEYTDQAYGRAMVDFVRAVASQIRSSGLLAAANVAANPWVGWQRAYGLEIAAHLTIYGREHYSRYGGICGPFSPRFNTTAENGTPPLGQVLAYDRAVQAVGARLLGIDYGYSPATVSDIATMAYGRAVFLLAWDGRDGAAYMYRPCGRVIPANPAWTVELGIPTAPPVLKGAAYHRSFTGGLVFLNPSPDKTVTVSVPAGYIDAQGIRVAGAVKLAPTTALLVHRVHSMAK